MDPNRTSTWQPSTLKSLASLLPLAVGQAYLVWLVATQRTTLFDLVLVSVIEIVATVWGGIVFLSPNEKVASRRLGEQKGLIFLLLFILYLALTVTTLTLRHAKQEPEGMLFEMTVTLCKSLVSPGLLYALPYLVITGGRSILLAERSDTQMRAWYANQFLPATSSFMAMFFTAFFGFFLPIAQASSYPTRLDPLVSLQLATLLGLLRVGVAAVFALKMTAGEFDKLYTNFRAGNDSVEGDREKLDNHWLPPPES